MHESRCIFRTPAALCLVAICHYQTLQWENTTQQARRRSSSALAPPTEYIITQVENWVRVVISH